jgi:hypothetical protein
MYRCILTAVYRIELRHNITVLQSNTSLNNVKTMVDIGANVFTEAVMYV